MENNLQFPPSFKFGVATASYQIEGGWNEDGKSQSIWDYETHTFPEKILDRSNGDVACDSYHKVDEDIKILKQLKVNFYRFSVAWTRILPTGFPNEINQKGVGYYNELIDKLIANRIEPVITIFHWDLPQSLQELGGWANPIMAEYFADYARICYRSFGDRVKTWITINEPFEITFLGYGISELAPFYHSDGIGIYLAGHNLLRGHAKAYRIYEKEFKAAQKGRVGISTELRWMEPYSNDPKDAEAVETSQQFHMGWFCHPIFSKSGDYPAIMRKRIDELSKLQGFSASRLPHFTKSEIEELKGASDFLGLNHYVTKKGQHRDIWSNTPNYMDDVGLNFHIEDEWETTARYVFRFAPWGLRKLLNQIKTEYNNPEVVITENGYAGFPEERLDDKKRVRYNNVYLEAVLKAVVEDGCNVSAYTSWSLMDNYEWKDGYQMRFGLYYVDFEDPERKRLPKKAAYAYQNIIVTRKIDHNLDLEDFAHK